MADSTNPELREENDTDNSLRRRKTQNSSSNLTTELRNVDVSADRTPSSVQPSVSHNSPTNGRSETAYGAVECSTREYAEAFRQWLWQYQWWTQTQMSMMYSPPMYPMNYMAMTSPLMNQQPTVINAGLGTANPSVTTPAGQAAAQGPVAQPLLANGLAQQPVRGRECRLPALWKRVAAEFIDFFLLFVMKLVASVMVVEYLGLLDMDKYDIDQLLAQDWDSTMALSFTSDLIAMEIINRIFICLFETLCLRRGFTGSVGGTTPGKYMMRLRVISCQGVAQLAGNRILVIPGEDIGFWNALVRSIIKNFSMVFFFPVCFTVFFFPNCRTAYDIASSSIVVEVTPQDLWAWPRR